jgi:hypothetical protein
LATARSAVVVVFSGAVTRGSCAFFDCLEDCMMSRSTLNQALPIVAAAYGRTFGVAVQMGGTQAHTDGRVIQLPGLREDASSKALAYGYLAHEAGHVRLTDFSLARHPQPLGRFLEGVLEDVRIETAMIRAYPGTRATLDAVIAQLICEGRMQAPRVNQPPAQLLSHAVLMLARYHYREQALLAPQAQQAEQSLREVFGTAFVARLQALLAEIPFLASTAEAMDLARRIMALLGAVAQEGPRRSRKQGASAVQGEAAQGDRIQGAGTATPSQVGPEREAGAEVATPASACQAAQVALSAGEDALPADLFATVGELLQAQAVPSAATMPTVERFLGEAVRGEQALRRVKGQSAHLCARLQGLVQSQQLTRARTVRQGRQLSAAALHRVGVGDARVFRQRTAQYQPNTALHLVVDLSGSMTGGADRLALDAALALAWALESIPGVSRAVTAFPGPQGQAQQVTSLLAHGERVASRAGAFVQTGRGGTPMSGALWFAAADLIARPEPRKVLITLSDGEPNQRDRVLELIQRAQAAGLELAGIGIQHEVGHLFPVARRIDAVSELKQAVFAVAEQVLLGRRG